MTRIVGEIVIAAPVDTVFDTVADERNEPRYNPRMLSVAQVTAGPVGVGTRFVAQMRTRGRPTLTIEYTEVDRPRALASVSRMSGMEVTGRLTFAAADGGGTLMRWSWDVRCRGWLRMAGPLVRAVGARQERAVWGGLREYVERGVGPGG